MRNFLHVDEIDESRIFISGDEIKGAVPGFLAGEMVAIEVYKDHLSALVSELAAHLSDVPAIRKAFDESLIRYGEMREEE